MSTATPTPPPPPPPPPTTTTSSSSPPKLPLKDYFAVHSYLSTLLCASFFFLPHSSTWLLGAAMPSQRASTDRPEHPFLTPLTSRPLLSMAWSVFGVMICMAWWAHRTNQWFNGNQVIKDVVDESQVNERQQRNSRAMQRYGQTIAACCIVAMFIIILASLLGTPLNSHLAHTSLFALHTAVLLVWPIVYTLGIPSLYDNGLHARYRMTRLFCDFRPETPLERMLVYPVIGTLAGAWIGAAPIPLDWDRPWQSYPLTPTLGSIIGFIIGGYSSWLHSAVEDTLRDVQIRPAVNTRSRKKKSK